MLAQLKKRKFLYIVIILVLTLVTYLWWRGDKNGEIKLKSLPIFVGDLDVSILSTGSVQPENRLDIKAPVAGRMDQVLVREGQRLKKGQIIAWMSSSERAALLDAARAKGEEEYKRWTEIYLATPIMAPISGTLITRNVEPGQTFTNADAIFTMSDRLTVKAQVDETDISQIKLNEHAEIILDAYPGQKIKATVDQIAFDAKTVNSVTTYIVDVLPEKTPEFMRSGMTANVTFFIESRKNILLVPNEAIRVKDGKTVVSIKNTNGKEQLQEVQLGISDGKNSEVLSGLKEGDVALVTEVKLNRDQKKGSNPFSPMGSGHAPRR